MGVRYSHCTGLGIESQGRLYELWFLGVFISPPELIHMLHTGAFNCIDCMGSNGKMTGWRNGRNVEGSGSWM